MTDQAINVALLDDAVSDCTLFCHVMAEVKAWQLKPTACSTVTSFERHLIDHQVQIAFVDYYLGDQLGTDVVASLSPRYPQIAFVIVTGAGDEEAATRSLRVGAIDYISKEALRVNVVGEVIERVIQEHYVRRQAQVFYQTLSHAVVIYDLEGVIHDVNPGAERIWGYSRDQLIGNNWGVISSADFRHFFETMPKQELRKLMSQGISEPMEVRSERKDGTPLFIEVTTGEISCIGMQRRYAMITDVTQRRQVKLLQTQRSAVLESSSDIVALLDARAYITYLNPTGHRLLDVPDGREISGEPIHILDFLKAYSDIVNKDNVLTFLENDLDKPVRYKVNKFNSDESLMVSSVTTALKNDFGVAEGFTAVLRDIQRDVANEERLRKIAFNDELTGLPNRKAFLKYVEDCMSRAGARLALMFIDLDEFKGVNDTLGHDAGDRMLRECASRLLQFQDERHYVARLGGDEFVLLMLDPIDDAETEGVAQTVLESLRKPFTLLTDTLYNSASIGIAYATRDADSVSALLRCSDMAMYAAKQRGRNQYAVYGEDLAHKQSRQEYLRQGLSRALAQNELSIDYQTIVGVDGGVEGLEALLRWQFEGDAVSPATFIPIAEKSGLIAELGNWVIERALSDLAGWSENNGFSGFLALNVSMQQIVSAHFAENVDRALKKYGIEPQRLMLEVAETPLVDDLERGMEMIDRLQSLGVQIAIDDFGTGYASFQHLRQLPISFLKVDKSFLQGVPDDEEKCETVRTLLDLAHSFRQRVVVEGVESPEQAAWLAQFPAVLRQGFYYQRPQAPAQLFPSASAEVE